MKNSRYPLLYQINTRVWLTELSSRLRRPATLDDVPDSELDKIRDQGFEWVWFLSVWQTGQAGRAVSLSQADWRRDFAGTLPDLKDDDIGGSGFAITSYTVHEKLGGKEALKRLRERLNQRGLKLMLDFVPNHMALDHPWVSDHPEYFVQGTDLELQLAPQNYTRLKTKAGSMVFAHGRDPYFPGWPDTLQLNYANPDTHKAMQGELMIIADQCDGVRCDMAMLILPDVFERTWAHRPQPFWPEATSRVRGKYPGFLFMAEVYWDLEWTLQHQGFDYTYDKRLYDRLRDGRPAAVRDHLKAASEYQERMARFLENHDEPRAAAIFSKEVHKAAAIITFLSTGLRFFHQGQFEGHTKRISPHLIRGPVISADKDIQEFYQRLLEVLRNPVVHQGQWQLLQCDAGWEGNWTWECFICFSWQNEKDEPLLVAVNYSSNQSQCYLRLPFKNLKNRSFRLSDKLSDIAYDREGAQLTEHGLFLDMAPWQAQVFSFSEIKQTASVR